MADFFDTSDLQIGYVDIVAYLRSCGHEVECRGQRTREAHHVTIALNPREMMLPLGVGRSPNLKLAAMEALQMIACLSDPEKLSIAAPGYTDVLTDKKLAQQRYAAYGPRLLDQWNELIELLHADPTTRQAVLQIWQPADLTHDGDKPCTLSLQFMIRDRKLHCSTTMRSNDVWLGLAYDAFVFTQVQYTVLNALNMMRTLDNQLTTGDYTHFVGSLHLYERNLSTSLALHYPAQHFRVLDKPPTGIHAPVDAVVYGSDAARAYLIDTNYLSNFASDLIYGIAENDVIKQNRWYTDRLAAMDIKQHAHVSAE